MCDTVITRNGRVVENGCDIDVIYFDIRKAVDQVPHQRLLSKLASYGIAGNIIKWIADFVSNRCQQVRVGNCNSSKADVLSGIPQGIILGPILFALFTNELPENISSQCKIFADDTKLYRAANRSDINYYKMTLKAFKDGLQDGSYILM